MRSVEDEPGGPARKAVIRNSLGVGIATGAYGISFGALGVISGFSVLQTCLLSLLVFTGASQFALIGVVVSGGSPAAAAGSALLLGSRNTLYGLRLATLLQLRGLRRLLGAQLVIDESTAMAVAQPNQELARVGFFATGLSVFVLWNAGTVVGRGRRHGDRRPEHVRPRRGGRRRVPRAAVAAAVRLGGAAHGGAGALHWRWVWCRSRRRACPCSPLAWSRS